MSKQQLVDEIHKTVRKKFLRRSVILKGIDDLWQADLIDLRNLKRYNSGFTFILVVIDCFSKFAWAIPVKTKTKNEIASAFVKILTTSHRAPVNLQTDMGKEFFNDTFKRLTESLKINHYSTFSVKKASIVERLIRTLKSKLYKYFSFSGSYKWFSQPLADVLLSYNNTQHSSTKYKPCDVNLSNQCEVMKNIMKSRLKNYKAQKNKFRVGDLVRISKYKGSFEKGYTPNWSTELFLIKSVNDTKPITYTIEDSYKQPILGTFYEQELQKTECGNVYLIEKVVKKRGSNLFVKWLGLPESENSWIKKADIL